jgi:hypothetical protein
MIISVIQFLFNFLKIFNHLEIIKLDSNSSFKFEILNSLFATFFINIDK